MACTVFFIAQIDLLTMHSPLPIAQKLIILHNTNLSSHNSLKLQQQSCFSHKNKASSL